MRNYKHFIFFTKLKKVTFDLFRATLIISISFIILFPLISKVPSAIMIEADAIDRTIRWLPTSFTLNNFRQAFELMNFPVSFWNSFSLAVLVSVLQVISATVIGYGLGRFEFFGRKFVFALVILTLIVPLQMIMIPMYLNLRAFNLFGLLPFSVNLLGSHWPYILTSITGTGFRHGLFIYIMVQFFKGMPTALEEAAYVDGAGYYTTFFRIMLPGAGPAIIVVFLFSFVWQWNDIFVSSIYLGGSPEYLPFALERIMHIFYERRTEYRVTWQMASMVNNAGMLMFIAPLLIMYAALQKYFIESVERTGLVG